MLLLSCHRYLDKLIVEFMNMVRHDRYVRFECIGIVEKTNSLRSGTGGGRNKIPLQLPQRHHNVFFLDGIFIGGSG